MPRSIHALLIVGLLAFAHSPSPAEACQCLLVSSEGAREQATAVFEGRLERFETVDEVSYAVFEVQRVWKGQVTRSVRVRAAQLTMCPPHLQVGETRIVYAVGPANSLRIDTCSRTAFSGNDAAELGPSRRPRSR
ncbi:MAG: hypothetical protein ACI9KE_002181 [Polyangiales bacterium]|jgi:hypothetical protein